MMEKAMGQEPKLSTVGLKGKFGSVIDRAMCMESSSTSASMRNAVARSTGLSAADSCCPSLTVKQRVQGCLSCFCVGVCTALLGWLSFWSGHIVTYAVLYTLGNMIALCGTCFLFGPKRQARQMFAPCRRYTSMIYLGMMIFTLG